MHNSTSDEEGRGYNVQPTQSEPHAENNGENQPTPIVILTICDVDIPCVLLGGELYATCPLPQLFDAFAASLSETLRNLETGISEARRTALASAHLQRSLFGEGLAIKFVVPNSGEW